MGQLRSKSGALTRKPFNPLCLSESWGKLMSRLLMKLLILIFALCLLVLSMVGCNAGDENPVTPEKMQQISNSQDRGNFQPKGTDQSPGQTR
jgi:hypothetical protein